MRRSGNVIELRRRSADPEKVGRAVLEALAKGRKRGRAIRAERAKALSDLIVAEARRDRDAGRPARGRAGRLHRRLRAIASERHIRRVLRQRFPDS